MNNTKEELIKKYEIFERLYVEALVELSKLKKKYEIVEPSKLKKN